MSEEKKPVPGESPASEKPSMFLRRGNKGGLYFFSPKKTFIYFMSGKHIRELLEGKRDFACIRKQQVLNMLINVNKEDVNNG